MTSLILRVAARYLFPLLILYSLLLLVRGHHVPGGGFIGGLTAAAAVMLCVFADGVPMAARVLRARPAHLIGTGLLVAAGSGLAGVPRGAPFLTGEWAELFIPGMGMVEMGTPLLFDVGVYLTVVGVVLAILMTLAAETEGE